MKWKREGKSCKQRWRQCGKKRKKPGAGNIDGPKSWKVGNEPIRRGARPWCLWKFRPYPKFLMLVIQQNCGKRYKSIISSLEAGLSLNVENQTELVSHSYCLAVDITEFASLSKSCKRKTRIVNVYDNKIGIEQKWSRSSLRVQRAIEDISWARLIKYWVLIVWDINTHSTIWNPHYHWKQNARPLKMLIDTYKQWIYNDPDYATCPHSVGILIIDLALTSPELGPLCMWEIPKEYYLFSDHKLILVEWDEIEEEISRCQ